MKRIKRYAVAALALTMSIALVLLGMTVTAFAENAPDENDTNHLYSFAAAPIDIDQLELGIANIGYLLSVNGQSQVYEGENVDCYTLPKGEILTINAETGVNYRINISEHCKDESGKCFIGDYNGLLMSKYSVMKDGSIEYMRQIDDEQEVVLRGKTSFALPLPYEKSIFEDERELLYIVSVHASRNDSSGETEKENRDYYFKVIRDSQDNENPAAKFTDVPADSWYYQDVNIACRLGLIDGRTATTFVPNDNLTYAEAVKLAACMNQKYNDGTVTLENGDTNWYDTYVSYAKEKGIIDKDYNWNASVTRAEYVEIFAKALPNEAFSLKNEVNDGAVPDVAANHPQAEAIYKFYRAGILKGNDKKGSFKPDSNIRRCEVADILTRMMDPDSRVDVSL